MSGAYLPFVDTLEFVGYRQFFIVAGTMYTTSLGAPGMFLDAKGVPLVLAMACLSTWTFGVVNLLCRAMDVMLWVSSLVTSKFFSKKRAGT